MLELLFPGLSLWADRYTKALAVKGAELVPPFEGDIQWKHIENPGLADSLLKDHPKAVTGIHASACGLMSVILLADHRRRNAAERTGAWFLFLGALSNLFDRLTHGTVTDMFRFPRACGKLKQLVFNVADFMILLGAVFTLLGRLFRKKA